MAIYIMGDIHGCFDEFKMLLTKVAFNHQTDQLYLVGDLINRGPKSLEVMRYLLAHQDSIFPVLGNHDLSYLVYAEGETKLRKGDTYDVVAQSKDSKAIKQYLRNQPLMRTIPELNIAIAHAGIPPFWSIDEAMKLNQEVSELLATEKKKTYKKLIAEMFGNHPAAWLPTLEGLDRVRAIINYFTRMRYLNLDQSLDFDNKREEYDPAQMLPWFKFNRALNQDTQIFYGHWASLGIHHENNTHCLDSGCVWEGELTIARVDQGEIILTSASRDKTE